MSATCAPFFAGGVGLFGINMKLQREVFAYPHDYFIEGQLAFTVAADANLLTVGDVQLAGVLRRHMDMPPGADHLRPQFNVACRADQQRAARILQLAGFANRCFDAEGKAVGAGDFQLRYRAGWAEDAHVGERALRPTTVTHSWAANCPG